MSLAAPGHLTRKLSGRARAMFAEWTAAVLRDRAGEIGMDEATQARYRRRLEALAPRDRNRLREATRRWEDEHPRFDEDTSDKRADAVDPVIQSRFDRLVERGVYLGEIREDLRASVLRDFDNGCIASFLSGASKGQDGAFQDPLQIFVKNAGLLHTRGRYERGLACSYRLVYPRHWPAATVRWLFALADPVKLRDAGDPLPAGDHFEVFRSGGPCVAISWTRDKLVAAWFARKSPNPLIRRAILKASDVALYYSVAIWELRLPWQTALSDEFITLAGLESVPLDEDEAWGLMDQVAP